MAVTFEGQIVVAVDWTTFKASVSTRGLTAFIQYIDDGSTFTIFAFDSLLVLKCVIYKGTVPDGIVATYSQAQNDSDKADFTTNFQSSANQKTGAAVKAPSTPAVPADPALVVTLSPNNAITTSTGPNQHPIHSNATVTTSGSVVLGGFGVRDIFLVINITQIPTGSFPSLTYLMQEVDPGDQITAVGAVAVSAAQVTLGTQVISIPLSVTGLVRISWTVGGSGTSFTGVYATLTTKITTVQSGLDATGFERALLVDTLGRTAIIDPPDFGAAQGLGLTIDPVTNAPTSNYVNNVVPIVAILSNTQAGYPALGGKFQFRTPAGSENDYALFAYQVPAGYLLYVDSVEIGSFIVGAKSSTSATILEWAVAANSSTVSLATTSPHPPTFLPIGSHAALVSSVIGDPFLPGNLIYSPRTPVVVQPSRFFHIVLRVPVGNPTAKQVIRGFVTLSGFFQPVASVTAIFPVFSFLTPGSPQTFTVTLSSGGIGATAITVDGVPLTSITVLDDNTVQGVLPAGTYTAGIGSVHVIAPSAPAPLVNGFTFSTAAPPTLTALTYPLVASASGVGQPITLTGTGLSGVTFVSVGAALATGVSSTPTSVTFTPPVNIASATPYNITVTTIDGAATLIGAIYTLPASAAYCWYAAYGYNFGAGTWTDLIHGVTLSATIAGMTKPTFTPSWTNSQAALTWSGTNSLHNPAGITTQAQPVSVFVVGDITSTTDFNYFFDGGVSGGLAGVIFQGTNTAYLYAGGTPTATTTSFPTSTPGELEFKFSTAGLAGVELDNASPNFTFTNAPGSEVGFTVGSRYDGNATVSSGLIGDVGLIVIFSGTPSVADRAVIHGISQGIYATD